jgi:hypothetical protein
MKRHREFCDGAPHPENKGGVAATTDQLKKLTMAVETARKTGEDELFEYGSKARRTSHFCRRRPSAIRVRITAP